MLTAWGFNELPAIDKIGDYCFKMEFASEKDKVKVTEGGPWRHKGDALIVVHYDGLLQPSEVKIDSILLWIRLYDLPAAMMRVMCMPAG
jgi:hypothetical protein